MVQQTFGATVHVGPAGPGASRPPVPRIAGKLVTPPVRLVASTGRG